MDYVELVGLVAGVLMTVSFFPQVAQVVKTKSTKDISLAMFLMFSAGIACWLTFGILVNSLAMIISNSIILVLSFVILGFKFKYK